MLNRLAWLLIATLMAVTIGRAQDPQEKSPTAKAKGNARAVRHESRIPKNEIHSNVKRGLRPTGMDRQLPPDAYPTNVVKILRTTNKAQTNTYVPVVFNFTKNNPFNVIRFLHRPIQLEEGTLFTFVNPEGTGGKVLYVVPDYMVPSLRDLVATIDRPGLTTSGGDLRIYRQLNHRRADLTDPDFLAAATSFSTRNGNTLIADPEENALYWEDAPSGGKALDAALNEWLDMPTAMVELVVKVYELDATNDAAIGLDYLAWKNGPGANLFAVGASAEHGGLGRQENSSFDPIGTGAQGLPKNNFTANGYNYAFRYDVSSAFFDFLAVKGKARVLNSMKLAALNTRPASLSAGDQILYYAVKTSDPSGIRDTENPFQANGGRVVVGTTNKATKVTVGDKTQTVLTPVETGLSLDILPVIGEQTVKMALTIKWSDYTFVDDTGFPVINKHKLDTTLRAKLGDEFIIGGLNRDVVAKATNKVPILGSLPILGYLFGGENTNTKKTEVVVVIQPTAVFDYDVAKDFKVRDSDQEVMNTASGKKPIAMPPTTWGTEMPGLDKEYGAQAPLPDGEPVVVPPAAVPQTDPAPAAK